MTKERREQVYQTVNRGWFSNVLDKNEIVELLVAADELERVKYGLAAKLKLIDAIWLIVRKHGYEYGPLNEAVGQMVHDIIEQREELKKELECVRGEQSKLLKWKDGIIRNSPTCPACAEQLFCGSTSVEHTCSVKENADLKRDKERLEKMERRLVALMPLFEEARDALPAISLASARLLGIRLDLAARMDEVGDPEKWNLRESNAARSQAKEGAR